MSDDKLQAKIEKRIKERDNLSKLVQEHIDLLATAINKLIDHDMKTYPMLSNPDCLYSDSPISKLFTYEWIKQYMIKKDLDFIGYILDGKSSALPFVDRMLEASGWVNRFTKEPEAKKTGISAII